MKKTLVALGILMAFALTAQTTFASCPLQHHHKHMMKKIHHSRSMIQGYEPAGCPCTDPCPCKKPAPCPCGFAAPVATPCGCGCGCAAPCPCPAAPCENNSSDCCCD